MPAGEWGPDEIVRHLIAVEAEVWTLRFGQLAAGEHPALGVDRARPGGRASTASRWTGSWPRSLRPGRPRSRPSTGFDDAEWARIGTHATYGDLDVAGLLRLATDHDADHLAGLARQRGALTGSGPTRTLVLVLAVPRCTTSRDSPSRFGGIQWAAGRSGAVEEQSIGTSPGPYPP